MCATSTCEQEEETMNKKWSCGVMEYWSVGMRARTSRIGADQREESSVRSGMFIEKVSENRPSSVGAACLAIPILVWGHAAPTELGISFPKPRCYKHVAPNGASTS